MNALPVRLTIDQAWKKWHENKDPLAREWLVVHYASLVKFVAGRLAAGLPKRVEIGDLVSSGVFGLMNAIDRFDPSLGFKFETYAVPRIRGAILDSLRSLDWVPRSVRSKARTVENAISDLEHALKRSPTDDELAAKLKINSSELEKWLTEIASSAVGPLPITHQHLHILGRHMFRVQTRSSKPKNCAKLCAKKLNVYQNANAQFWCCTTRRT